MLELNQETISNFNRIIKPAESPCPLFAALHKTKVIVTNGRVLLEWPQKMVDQECPAFSKLLDAQKHPHARNHATGLTKRYWADYLFNPKTGTFLSAQMEDPTDKELRDMKEAKSYLYVFTAGTFPKRIYYDYTTFNMLDFFVPRATLKIFRMGDNEYNQSLVLFEDDILVGAGSPSLL